MVSPALLFFLKVVLDIKGLLWFHINLRIISVKNATGVCSVLITRLFINKQKKHKVTASRKYQFQ